MKYVSTDEGNHAPANQTGAEDAEDHQCGTTGATLFFLRLPRLIRRQIRAAVGTDVGQTGNGLLTFRTMSRTAGAMGVG